jgi:heme oxygenase
MNSSPTPDLMTRLRESTAAAHRDAETRPLMRSFARGTVSRAQFRAHLEQLLLVHRVLEPRLADCVAAEPAWQSIAIDDRRRVPDLESDLAMLGGSLDPDPLPATRAAQEVIRRATPLAVLGMFYVTEGSTNGGRILTRPVGRALGLGAEGRSGLRSMEPYGEDQPARWAEYRRAMNALAVGAVEAEAIETGARLMFEHLGRIADAVHAAVPA